MPACWIEVDLDAVADNVRALQAAAEPRAGVTAVVKAQAYGMGGTAVANAAIGAGARGVAVSRVREARHLRAAGFDKPILLLGGVDEDFADEIVALDVTPSLSLWSSAECLAAAASRAGRTLGVQVKVDTGMTRYGAPPDEATHIVRSLPNLPSLRLDGFYTHFAAADDPDPFFAHQQLARYLAICEQLEHDGYALGLKHAANSAGALRVPGSGLDTIRAGIALAGGYATGWVPRLGALRPAVALKSRVVRLHTPAIGTSIGYGRTYKVYRPMRVALISCGYADGLPRDCSNRGRVLIRGERAALVGTVSMDMAMADVSQLPDVEPGDEVVILGRQGEDEITLDEFAESAGIIPHELLVRLGSRAPRVYLRDGQPCATADLDEEAVRGERVSLQVPRIVDLIEKKRDGGAHSRAELEALVDGFVRGDVPDYQVAAWLMAVCVRGMAPDEVVALTQVMAASGEQLDLSSIGRPVADKHSTGGVGDKTSLVVMPLVAACGVPVGKMSGRGLGFTGGTIDKLESFPGIRLDLPAAEFVRQLRDIGIVITGQSADLAPADGRLYALRDVTGTVPSLPLIASSIMSKKLAAGANVIVLDVKTGSGAFMRDPAAARELARAMVDIGTAAGRRMAAVVSDMSQPLGRMVGNALEMREALDTLAGSGPPEFTDFAVELASLIVSLATDARKGRSEVEDALRSGAGSSRLRTMIEAQGGDAAAIDDRSRLPAARLRTPVVAELSGVLAALDALTVARASISLGAGRERKGDPIDLAVGVELLARVGDQLEAGQPFAVIHANDESRVPEAERLLHEATRISAEPVPPRPLILDRLGS